MKESISAEDLIEFYDAGIDIIYGTMQQMVMHGFPVDAGLREVHRSNMSKEGRDADGKVMKGDNYSPPDLAAVLKKHMEELRKDG
jgi:predicted HAD superfamily Cof-like phosphohydrolase